jgi:hypothetical protein
LTRLIRSLALMTVIKNLGRHNVPSASISLCGFLTDTTTEVWGLLSMTVIRVP